MIWIIFRLLAPGKKRPNAPVFGHRSLFEPDILLKSRFILGARDLIHGAYKKMNNQPFVLRRYDVDFLILPMKYLEEIRLISPDKLSSKGAQTGNLAPHYTSMQFLFHSNLHLDVLKKKLTPELYKYVDKARRELAFGWKKDLPQADDWTEVPIEHHLRTLVARMTAKVFMGSPTCRDPEWLKISVDFSVDLFTTAFTIKMFPPWMYGLVARVIPARYRTFRQLKAGRKIVGELTQQHNLVKERKQRGEKVEEEDTLLHWMLDHGTPSEVEVHEMGARQCVLTLASIHTTASNVSNMLYDLCAHPEWFEVLREEAREIARELGPPCQNMGVSAKEWCTRLDKLDSFFVESQRHNPVLLLNPQRLAYQDIKLKDGTVVPAGSRLAFANYEHSMDPDVYPNPLDFDPMRSYRKRMSDIDQRDLHKAGMTHPNNLAFGYGNQACAGRQFAVAEIKLIMARLLCEYEFKFPEGKVRPKTQHINENCFTDQSMNLMMKRL
ncbi:hypothetical protein N7456_007118 [Penicillium angulare]|uniref:Cytochrome P450 n=1 Tax=Penicillium angulare TaxID=116970 RepID=A0A9W9FIZ5_9EURO|nr:hypothetical protein N7456_007118 [Penicillium angulare]